MAEMLDSLVLGGHVRRATEDFFKLMVGLPVAAGDAVSTPHTTVRRDGVFAMVGIAGWVTGTGTLSMSETLACGVANAFLGSDYREVTFDVLDAVGEMANIVIGQLKTMLEAHGDSLQLTLPAVVYGKNFMARALSRQNALAIDFTVEGETLTVTVCLALECTGGASTEAFLHPHYVAG